MMQLFIAFRMTNIPNRPIFWNQAIDINHKEASLLQTNLDPGSKRWQRLGSQPYDKTLLRYNLFYLELYGIILAILEWGEHFQGIIVGTAPNPTKRRQHEQRLKPPAPIFWGRAAARPYAGEGKKMMPDSMEPGIGRELSEY